MVRDVGWQSSTRLPLKIGPIRFPETPVTNNHLLLRNIPLKPRRKHKYLHTTFQNVIVIGRPVARPRTHRVQRLPVRVHTCMYTRLNFALFLPYITISSSRHQTNKMHKIVLRYLYYHTEYTHMLRSARAVVRESIQTNASLNQTCFFYTQLTWYKRVNFFLILNRHS